MQLSNGRLELNGRPWFVHGIELALPCDVDNVTALAVFIHADAFICKTLPDEDLLNVCDRRGIYVLFGGKDDRVSLHSSVIPVPGSLPLLRYSVEVEAAPGEPVDREFWAAELRSSLSRGRASGAAGVCLVDSDRLLSSAAEPLRWHAAACFRRVRPAAQRIGVSGWRPTFQVPVECDLQSIRFSDLEAHWELLDTARVVTRGRGTCIDAPSAGTQAVAAGLIGAALSPDHFVHDPRLRIRFHGTAPERCSEAPPAVLGDRLVVRGPGSKPAEPGGSHPPADPAMVALSAVEPEVARIEVGLEILPAVSCAIEADPVISTHESDVTINVRLQNRTPEPLDVEVRLTLHAPGKRARSVRVSVQSLAANGTYTAAEHIPAAFMAPGSNYVMVGFSSRAGVGVKSCLVYCAEPGEELFGYRNTTSAAAIFWTWKTPDSLPVRLELGGYEERVEVLSEKSQTSPPPPYALRDTDIVALKTALSSARVRAGDRWMASSDPTEWTCLPGGIAVLRRSWFQQAITPATAPTSYTMNCWLYPDGLFRVELGSDNADLGGNKAEGASPWVVMVVPEAWTEIVWLRQPLWDCYPRSHPDAPTGAASAPLDLFSVQRLSLCGPAGGAALLTDGNHLLDIRCRAGEIWLRASRGAGSGRTAVGLWPAADFASASDLWLSHPPGVEILS